MKEIPEHAVKKKTKKKTSLLCEVVIIFIVLILSLVPVRLRSPAVKERTSSEMCHQGLSLTVTCVGSGMRRN